MNSFNYKCGQELMNPFRIRSVSFICRILFVTLFFPSVLYDLAAADNSVSKLEVLATNPEFMTESKKRKLVYPTSMLRRYGAWRAVYDFTTPVPVLFTMLQMEISNKLYGEVSFPEDEYVELFDKTYATSSRRNHEEYAIADLYILELLYRITNKRRYKVLFDERMEGFMRTFPHLPDETLNSLGEGRDYYSYRALSYKISNNLIETEEYSPRMSYISHAYRRNADDADINSRCRTLWAFSPLIRSGSLTGQFRLFFTNLYREFDEKMRKDPRAFQGIREVSLCLIAFTELEAVYEFPLRPVFKLAHENYIKKIYNYSTHANCPVPGGVFSSLAEVKHDCGGGSMTLEENVLLNYAIYRYLY
jgi:hypothetical protein